MSTNYISQPVEIRAIKFAFLDGEEQSVAVPLFRPVAPEYPIDKKIVVAFPITKLQPQVKILGCFQAVDPALVNKVVTVRAVILENGVYQTVTHQSFVFRADTYSSYQSKEGFIPFMVDTNVVFGEDRGVGIVDSTWYWQWCISAVQGNEGDWHDLCTMYCEFFLILDLPTYPWGWKADFNGSNSDVLVPLVSFVRHGCTWAQGAKTELEVARKITAALHNPTLFQYSLSPAYSKYDMDSNTGYPMTPEQSSFFQVDGTALKDHLRGWHGNGSQVNCVDMAHFVMLFCNTLGCKIWVGRLENSNQPNTQFDLNEICPLGGIISSSTSFLFHFVAYLGDDFGNDSLIFDACLAFPDGSNPPISVLGMPQKEYIQRLVKNPYSCLPQHYKARKRISVI